MIKIYRASAGSGKTFTLTKQYISLLLSKKDRFAYRHILAVTFTNKATEEMKSRILRELHILSLTPEKSGYFNDFVPGFFPDKETLGEAAGQMLSNILHDYGAFSVSTIDRFFQQTLRAFSREVGRFSPYQVELGKENLIREAVDRVLDSLTEESTDTLKWLTESAKDQISQGKKYSVDASLYKMAERLKSEEHRIAIEENGIDEETAYSKESLKQLKGVCDDIIKKFTVEVKDAAEKVDSQIESCRLDINDTIAVGRKPFMTAFCPYSKVSVGSEISAPTDHFIERAPDSEKWFSKANAPKYKGRDFSGLESALESFCNLFTGNKYKTYRTARIIREQIYQLGMSREFNSEFSKLLEEKNVLSIDDSNLLLNQIVGEADAPFIYEKTGVRYENFLLDEFQDTAVIQWKNMLPLLRESEGGGNDNLIVGDVKQSIYRFRNSDWKMLDHGLQEEFREDEVEVMTLDTNYRSCKNIVKFNNEFFSTLAVQIDRMLSEEDFLKRIYMDVCQKCASTDEGGVSVTFCRGEEELDRVLSAIRELVPATDASSKVRYCDIAVLVRGKNEGEKVAAHLIANNIKVVTSDSLKVKSSLTVNRLTSMLSYVDNPSDTVGCYLAGTLGLDLPESYNSLVGLCEELVRGLRAFDRVAFESEVAYVQAFVDDVADYVRLNGNSLHGFLEHWEGTDISIFAPMDLDAVMITTIHKAKGLDFQYVILPFAEKITLYGHNSHWCIPDAGGTILESVDKSIFDVDLCGGSENTLFAEDYHQERRKQCVDNMNILYVAMTRAVKGMYIIAKNPSKKVKDYKGGDWPQIIDFSQALYLFVRSADARDIGVHPMVTEGDAEKFCLGKIADDGAVRAGLGATDCETMDRGDGGGIDAGEGQIDEIGTRVGQIVSLYPSWRVNPDGQPVRLLLSRDSSDFFSSEENSDETKGYAVRVAASPRLRGIVLHSILSSVNRPEDLDAAVEKAVEDGSLSVQEGEQAATLLRSRLDAAVGRGWFAPESVVYNEAELINSDGNVYRPDRVELRPDGSVLVIDYKFGGKRRSYEAQIERYADIWRRMGHSKVTSALWYVVDDEVWFAQES